MPVSLSTASSGPSMLALVGDMTGPTLWRCLWPITALEKLGYPCGWDRTAAPAVKHLVSMYDGILFARTSWPTWGRGLVRGFIEEVHDAGRFVVLDYDDDLLTADFTYRQVELGWTDGKSFEQLEAERGERVWAVGCADGVTVSTEPLAQIVRSFTDRPVIVVPNAIHVPWFRSAVRRAKRRIRGFTIGWAGGKRPDADLAAMAEAWRRIAARYPVVTFVVQGYFPSVIRLQIPHDRLVVIPWLPLERYPEGLAEVDIACCAVAPDRFNACKTPIKAWEAAVAGCAVVATPFLYGAVLEHGTSGLLASTADEWEAALATLIERPSLRSLLSRRLLRRVEKHCSLTENLHRWPAAWAAIQEDARVRHRRVVAV